MKTATGNIILHTSQSRGLANHGWLLSRHTFSFANYFDPERIQFGALRVLNDDIVKPGMGFGTHPHENMEIVSIPLSGSLAHKDSTGRERVINEGEVQIMSAGTGIFHSEYNHSKSANVNFLQIWVLPKEKNIKPRYDQKDFSEALQKGGLVTVVSPSADGALWINQDAEFRLGHLEKGTTITHPLTSESHGIYAFLIDGQLTINEQILNKRDAVGIMDTSEITIEVQEDATLLLIEVPIN